MTDSGDEKNYGEDQHVLDSVDGECHFFRSLMRARPVGVNRFFHIITMQASIEKGIKQHVPIDDIWRKLESCYNLEQLEHLEAEYEMNANTSNSSTPQPTPSPKPDQNLAIHPWFRSEFMLPQDPFIDDLIATRRIRSTPSPPGTPSPPPAARIPGRRGRKRKIVEPSPEEQRPTPKSGESDISELTQQSGDDEDAAAAARTPSDKRAQSVATATEGGTEEPDEDEDDETKDAPRERKRPGRKPGRGRGGRRGRRKK